MADARQAAKSLRQSCQLTPEPDMPLFALSHARPDLLTEPGFRARPLGLNGPGTYLHWSFIDISVANLIVIAVMVVLFGAALLIRFPHAAADPAPAAGSAPAG